MTGPRVFSHPLPFGFDYFLEIGGVCSGYGRVDVVSWRPGDYELFVGSICLQISTPTPITKWIEGKITRDDGGAWELVIGRRRLRRPNA